MIYVFCLSAALAFAIGNVLQKKGLHQTRIDHHNLKDMVFATLKDVPWWSGILLSVVGTAAYYYAMAKWPLTQVQSLLSLNPVMTAVLGVLLLKEKWDRSTIWGIVLVLLGVLGVNLAPSSGQSSFSDTYWPITTLVLSVLLGISIWGVFPKLLNPQFEQTLTIKYRRSEWIYSIMTGLGFGISAVYYKGFSLNFDVNKPLSDLNGIGILLAALYALSYTIGFFSSQAALSYGRALFVVPFSAAIGTLVPILGGMVVLGENFSWTRALGVLFIGFALFLFVPRGDFSNIHKV